MRWLIVFSQAVHLTLRHQSSHLNRPFDGLHHLRTVNAVTSVARYLPQNAGFFQLSNVAIGSLEI